MRYFTSASEPRLCRRPVAASWQEPDGYDVPVELAKLELLRLLVWEETHRLTSEFGINRSSALIFADDHGFLT